MTILLFILLLTLRMSDLTITLSGSHSPFFPFEGLESQRVRGDHLMEAVGERNMYTYTRVHYYSHTGSSVAIQILKGVVRNVHILLCTHRKQHTSLHIHKYSPCTVHQRIHIHTHSRCTVPQRIHTHTHTGMT